MTAPLIELEGIYRSYRNGDVVTQALRGVDLRLRTSFSVNWPRPVIARGLNR